MSRMEHPRVLEANLFNVQSEKDFERIALSIFHYQIHNNPVYNNYCTLLGVEPAKVKAIEHIPFLPVEFFRRHRVLCGNDRWQNLFISSGTTGMERSKHYVKRLDIYRKSFLQTFERFYGSLRDYCILAVLPGYGEQRHSSLIYMVHELMEQTGHPESGFYLHDYPALVDKLQRLMDRHQKILLFGASYALLDLVESCKLQLKNTTVMETGGMKGRREEITREKLHAILMKGFGVRRIHSEYGMTELLSQAYAKESGIFHTPPWMKVMIRDVYDPFQYVGAGKSGGINVIDMANLYSCAFIETKDLGRLHDQGSFEVLGRFDYSDVRGCNLMVME